MDVDSVGGTSFSVWSPEQMQFLSTGAELEPIGRGSVDPYTECCLLWSGNFGDAGTDSVAVEGASSRTACYQLEINGDGVIP